MGLSSQLRIQAEQARKAGEERIARVSAPVSYPDYYEAQAAVTELKKKGDEESLQRARIIESSLSTDPSVAAEQKQKALEARAEQAALKAAEKEAVQKALEAKQAQYQAKGQTSLKVQSEIDAAKAEYQAALSEQKAMEAAKQEYITARSTLSSSLSREQQLRQDYLTAQSEKESTAKREKYTETVQVAVLANELPNWKGEANMQKYRPGAGAVVVGYKPVEVTKERVTYDPTYDQKMADIQKQLVETQREQDTLFAKHSEFNPYTNDEANAKFAQLYHSGYADLRAGSSMSGVIGYDAQSKSVQIGAGDSRGVVVSRSAAEDKMELERIKKDAGYVGKATIDPRVGVFKTTPDGILTPGFKASPSPDIIRDFKGSPAPQQTRPKILTNQPDSKYANPDFASKENQRKAGELSEFVQAGGSTIADGRDSYTLTFSDGRKLEGLTKQQAEEYVKTFKLGEDVAKMQRQTQRADIISFLKEAKAQGFTLLDIKTDGRKETIPIDSAFGRLITGGEATISYQDPKLKQARIDFVNTRRAQKKWLKEVEKSGAGFISIKSSMGTQVIPVEGAWDAIRKAPADAQISTRLPVVEKGIGPDKQTRDIIKYEQGRREISQDPVSQLTYASEKQKTKTILPGGAGEVEREYGTQVLSTFSGIVNLAENVDVGIRRGVGAMFKTPEPKLSQFPEPSSQMYVAPSYEAAYLGAAQEGLSKSAKPTDIGFGIKVPLPTLQTFGIAGKMLSDYEKTQTPNKLLAQKSFAVLQLTDPAIVPLRQVKIATALETRVPTMIGAPRLTSKMTEVAKGLKVGYSPQITKLELVKVKGGPVVAGVPAPSKIPQLEKVRGLEGRGGYPITEDTSGYMTKKPTLEYLTKKGALEKDEADILQQAKPYLKKAGKYKDEIKRTELPPQPVLSLEEGKETTAAFQKLESEQFKKSPTVGSLFGSVTEQFYVMDEFVEKSRDIDIHPMGRNAGPKAQKIAREFAQDIQDVARPERQFAVKESYVDEIKLATGEKTGKKEIDRITISVDTEPTTFKGKPLKPEYLDDVVPGIKPEQKSILSNDIENLEFHHITKGDGVKPYGVVLTYEEHKGITALMGQLGKIPKIKGSDYALELLAERKTIGSDYTKKLQTALSDTKTRKKLHDTLMEAAASVGKKEDSAQDLIKKFGGGTVYHGTSIKNAKEILRYGFKPSKSLSAKIGTTWVAKTPEMSGMYARAAQRGVMLKVTLSKDIKVLDAEKVINKSPQLAGEERVRLFAKEQGYDAIANLRSDQSLELISNRGIVAIEPLGRGSKAWRRAVKGSEEVAGAPMVSGDIMGKKIPGQYVNRWTYKLPENFRKKIKEGEEFDTKVSEFIVKSNDDKATGYGYKATDANKVMGFDVPDKSITVKDVKIGEYEGKQKIQTLRRQELRRLSAGFELQFEKTEFGSLRADPGREKEYAKIYAIAKTREAQAIKANKMDDAKLFSDYAESVKRFAEKRGIWKVGQYVDLADDSGVLTNPSLKDKTVNSLIQTSKTASRNPTTLINTVTPKNQYSPTEKDSPSFSTPNRSSSSSVLKYSSSSDIVRPTYSNISRIKKSSSESTVSVRSKVSEQSIYGKSERAGSAAPSKIKPRSAAPSKVSGYGASSMTGYSPRSVIQRQVYSRTPSSVTSRSVISVAPSKVPSPSVKPTRTTIPLYGEPQARKPITIATPQTFKTRTDRQKPNPPKGREDFFASSHAAEVMGFRKTKRGRPTDFDYGDVKTARLVEQDIALTTKGRAKFAGIKKKGAFISKAKPGIIQSEKSRQKNTFGKAKQWKKVF